MELSQQYKMKQDFLKKLKDPSLIDRLPERAKIELSFGGFANGITPKFQTPNFILMFKLNRVLQQRNLAYAAQIKRFSCYSKSLE